MRQLFDNPSWAAIWSLPPTEFLALVILAALAVVAALAVFVGAIYAGVAMYAKGDFNARPAFALLGVLVVIFLGTAHLFF